MAGSFHGVEDVAGGDEDDGVSIASALAVAGCRNERAVTVRGVLERVFARYGLSRRILCDNGSLWGNDAASLKTQLTV